MASHRYGEFAHSDLAPNTSISEKQDSMFDSYLEEMKPFVFRLTHKSGEFAHTHVLFTKFLCLITSAG